MLYPIPPHVSQALLVPGRVEKGERDRAADQLAANAPAEARVQLDLWPSNDQRDAHGWIAKVKNPFLRTLVPRHPVAIPPHRKQ